MSHHKIPKLSSQSTPETSHNIKMTPNQMTEMRKALENPLILQKIVNRLHFPELKACRLVSGQWCGFANEAIRAVGGHPKIFVRVDDGVKNLKKVLDKSSNFPFDSFRFKNDADFEDGAMYLFLHRHGHRMRKIGLCMTPNFHMSATSFRELLCLHATKMEELVIQNLFLDWTPMDCLPFEVNQLKKVSLDHLNCETIGRLLSAAPNLESIKIVCGQDLHALSVIKGAGKIDKITKIEIHPPPTIEAAGFQNHFNWTPFFQNDDSGGGGGPSKMKKFIFKISSMMDQQSKQKWIETLTKFLNCGAPTLEILNCSHLLGCVDVFKFLRMEKLKILTFFQNEPNNEPQRLFPEGLSLSEKFPILSTLDCSSLNLNSVANWEKYFPPNSSHGEFKTVQQLILTANCDAHVLPRFFEICPNFKKLTIKCHDDGGEFLDLVMLQNVFESWRHLEVIEIFLSPHQFFLKTTSLDPTITGMSRESCQWLLGQSGGSAEVKSLEERGKEIENFKIRPSIADLKGLKTFKICINNSSSNEKGAKLNKKVCQSPTMTCLSGGYGFAMLPNLKATILYDFSDEKIDKMIEKSVQCLGSRVNFGHFKNKS